MGKAINLTGLTLAQHQPNTGLTLHGLGMAKKRPKTRRQEAHEQTS